MLRRIETVMFKREENSEWEMGLQLNYGEIGILDRFGDFVDETWDVRDKQDLVIDSLDIILNREALDKVRKEEFEKQEQYEKEIEEMEDQEDGDFKEYRHGHGITEDFSIDIEEVKQYRNIGYTL